MKNFYLLHRKIGVIIPVLFCFNSGAAQDSGSAAQICRNRKQLKSILFTLLLLVFGLQLNFAQTTIISPTGDGGFETGTTFGPNGWTATTGTTTPLNQWTCGPGATAGFTGFRSAFISRNGTAHEYNKVSVKVSHLYRNITIPAGQTIINLNFNWICDGESTFDKMRIWIVPTTVTPTYGNQITPSGTAPTGNVQVGLINYSEQYSWAAAQTVVIPAAYAGTTVRIVFEWSNDNNTGQDPPAAIDNVSLTSQAPAICSGTPVAGSVTVTPTSGVPGSTYGVSATGYTTGTGLTYQWQYSDTGGASWTNQGAATNSYAALTGMVAPAFGVARTWRFVVTCTASGGSANSSTATFTSTYCTPTSTYTSDYISSFSTTGGVTNINNASGGLSGTGYGDFYATHSASQYAGSSLSFSESYVSGGSGFKIWVDWNRNGLFTDSGEQMYAATSYSSSNAGSFTIPISTSAGDYHMRIRADYNTLNVIPCGNISYGEAEDYKLTVLTLPPCSTPTAQPTALALTPASTTITGSFTAASPAPNSYLVVISTNATAPTPVNGTTYTVGGTVGAGYTAVDTDSNITFTATGLSPSTLYYVYVFSYNNQCTGGPRYNTTTPLTGSTTTLTVAYCQPTSWQPNGLYISSFEFVGTLADPPVNSSTYSATGFQNFTALTPKARQAQGEGINIKAHAVGNTMEGGTWKAWVDWNKSGTFEPATEEIYNIQGFAGSDVNFGFVIPPGTPPGDYRLRIRVNNGIDYWDYTETFGFDFSPCDNFQQYAPYDWWITDYGETEDYLLTVEAKCSSLITSVTNGQRCSAGTVNLQATATAGVTEFRWYTTPSDGSYVTSTVTGNSTTFTTPVIGNTTNFYVTAYNGTCESQVRTLVVAKVNQTPVVAFTPAAPIICGDNVILQITAGGDKETITLIDEDFETGSLLGVFSNLNNDTNSATVKANTSWKQRTSTFIPTTNVWYPAVSSGFGTNKFALAYSDSKNPNYPTTTVENSLTLTDNVSTTDFLNLTLTLKMYYSRYFPDGYNDPDPTVNEYANIEVSTDGGATYPNVIQSFISDVGIGTKFLDLSYDLSAYINQPNLKIRIRHRSYAGDGWLPDGVGIDDVKLFGERPLNTSFKYNTSTVDAFTDAATTIPYVSGTLSPTIYLKPSASQIENYSSFVIPVTATLSNGCSATGTLNIINDNKIWNNTASVNNWASAANWKPSSVPAVPTADKCVIIKSPVNILSTTNAVAKNLRIESNGKLNIEANGSLTVTDGIINQATDADLVIASDGNLKQIADVQVSPNTGSATAKRNIKFRNGTRAEYNYLISPVVGQRLNTIYPGISYVLYHNEVNNMFGNSSGAYIPGRGLAVKEATMAGVSANNVDATFKGALANGVINFPLAYTDAAHGYNLVGNPYPSNINLQTFYTLNSGKISSTFYFWDNAANNVYQQQGSGYSGRAYAVLNASNGMGNAAGYLLSPQETLNTKVPNAIAKVGQGFMVRALGAGTNLVFNNSIRTTDNTGASFFSKPADSAANRYWLRLITPTGLVNTIGVVYYEGGSASFGMDDSEMNVDASDMLYSMADDRRLQIEGRPVFEDTEKINLGSHHFAAGNYTLSLGDKEGIFAGSQNIYLKDKQTGTVTNLSEGDYTFAANAGESTGRFEIIYKPEIVLVTDSARKEELIVYRDAQDFIIKAQTKEISAVEVYDSSGRMIYKIQPNDTTAVIHSAFMPQGVYILKITTADGAVISKKILK